MTQIIAERKNVIFQFVENTTANRFVNTHHAGLLVSSQDTNQSGVARWGKVTQVGEDVDGIAVGEYILIEPSRWTSGFYVDGVRFWKTDEEQIMAVSDEPDYTY